MLYVGIDLHKKTISLCVVNKDRTVLDRQRFHCKKVQEIRAYFENLGEPFQFVVEAMGTYEWLVQLLEPLAESWVLAHPGQMRVIAESTKKTDRVDAQILAEFLSLGMIPKAYRPTPREREHRVLVRHRVSCQRRVSRLKCQIRHLAACYNADRRDLFSAECLDELRDRADMTGADRFVLKQYLKEYDEALKHLSVAKLEVKSFAKKGGESEQKSREIVRSAPGVGEVVSEVVLAELGNVDRFDSIKEVTAYAGLVPSKRESDGKGKELGITKKGSRLLRWAMVEAAWQAIRSSTRWRGVYESLKRRRGGKRAIVAVARRLLGVLGSMLRSGQKYRWSLPELRYRESQAEQRKEKRRLAQEAKAARKEPQVPSKSETNSTAKGRKKATVGV